MNLSPTLHFSALADLFLPEGFRHLKPPHAALFRRVRPDSQTPREVNLLAADLSVGAVRRLGTGPVLLALVGTLGRALLLGVLHQRTHLLAPHQRLLALHKYRGDGAGEGHVQHIRHGLGQVVGIHRLVVNQCIQRFKVFPAIAFWLKVVVINASWICEV